MIDLRVLYNVDSIASMFKNEHFLLEAISETLLEAKPRNLLIRDAKEACSSKAIRRSIVEQMEKYVPVEVLTFIGMTKFSSDWWSATLRLQSTEEKQDIVFLLLGWTSKRFGTKAVVFKSGSIDAIDVDMNSRVAEKERKGYTKTFISHNIQLNTIVVKPPPLDEEVAARKREKRKRITFAEIMSGALVPEDAESVDEEPKPKKKARKRRSKTDDTKEDDVRAQEIGENSSEKDCKIEDLPNTENSSVSKGSSGESGLLEIIRRRQETSEW